MKLSAISVYNWREFQLTHNIKFNCFCAGKTTQCLYCNNTNEILPVNPVAYDTGYEIAGIINQMPYVGVVAFVYQNRIWLATRLGENTYPAPYLAMAWIRLFPNSQWLPEQFGDVNSVVDFYNVLPKEDADTVISKLRKSLSLNIEKSQEDLNKLNEIKPFWIEE